MQTEVSPLDPSFRERFSCSLEEITFKAPSAVGFYLYTLSQLHSENPSMFPDIAQIPEQE